MKILINFLILTLLLSGCKSTQEITKEEVHGKYQWHGIYGVASNITLKKDETFVYNWQAGLIGGTTNGNWELKKNTLILHSERQPGEKKYRIISTKKTNSGQYEIKVTNKEKSSLPFTVCSLMNDTMHVKTAIADSNGVCILPILDEANILRFQFLTSITEVPLSDLSGNLFTLEMDEFNDYYQYFTNREWKIKHGRIIDPEIKLNKYTKRNYYEKVKIQHPNPSE